MDTQITLDFYDKWYLILMLLLSYGMWYFYQRDKNTREEDVDYFCEKCNEKLTYLTETKSGELKYKCPECKHRGEIKGA